MTVMTDLAALQDVDVELDRLERQAAELRTRIADDESLRVLQTLRDTVAAQLQQHQLAQRSLEGQSASETAEIERRERRLAAGTIRDAAGYTATQHEIEQHTARRRDIEDSLLAAMEDVEVTTARLAQVERDLEEKRGQRAQQVAADQQELAAVQAQIAEQRALRTKRDAVVPPGALVMYDRLRQQKGGRAVSTVQAGVCGVCRVRIPPTTLSKARPGVAFVHCDNCHRLLFVPR